jgi:hypothetical protein
MGGLLSPANILARNGRSYSTAIATGTAQVRAIPIDLIKKICNKINLINPYVGLRYNLLRTVLI